MVAGELGGVYWSGGVSGLGSGRLLARYFARMLEVYCGQNRKTSLNSSLKPEMSRTDRKDQDPTRLKPYRSSPTRAGTYKHHGSKTHHVSS